MKIRSDGVMLAFTTIVSLAAFRPRDTPEEEFGAIVRAWVTMGLPSDWAQLEALPNVRWASLPPKSLDNCAPDGGTGSSNWYRLGGGNVSPSFLSVQPATARRNNEGFVLSSGADLPKLHPNQLALYSEQCAAGAVQQPVSTTRPHEQIAQTVVALLVPTSGAVSYDWKSLAALPIGISWDAAGAKRVDLSYRNDRNPYSLSGSVTLASRSFSALASGTQTQVKVIYLDESQLHPRGEHMLGVVYQKGIAVQLRRCGPVYTESTNNWYALTSANTRPAMIRQSLRYDGNQVQDAYELRLDGSLPVRDPRDRDPGVNGCR